MVLKIGFDIDGTITTPDNLIPLIQRRFKEDFKYEDLIEYDIDKVLGVSKEDVIEFFKENHELIVLNPNMMTDSVKTINLLKEEGHDLCLITARHISTKEDTFKWLKREGILVNESKVYFVGNHNKEELIQELDLDIYVDDRLETLLEVNRVMSGKCKTILIDAPYNRSYKERDVIRVRNYEELNKELDKYLK